MSDTKSQNVERKCRPPDFGGGVRFLGVLSIYVKFVGCINSNVKK